MATNKIRINVYISPDVAERVKNQSKSLGVSQSIVVNLALRAGLDALSMATDPDWKAYFEAMIRKGENDVSESGR